jgi:sugar lactone lactonase YvrE
LLWENLPAPIDVELIDGRLLWTDRGAGTLPGGNSLNRAAVPPRGEKGEAPEILADGFGEAIGLAVDREEHIAYVADLSGKIWAVPAPETTGTKKHVVVDLGFPVTGLNLVKD